MEADLDGVDSVVLEDRASHRIPERLEQRKALFSNNLCSPPGDDAVIDRVGKLVASGGGVHVVHECDVELKRLGSLLLTL
jgi:hypothetical protein